MNIKRGQIRGELNTAACKNNHITVVNNGHQRNTEKLNRSYSRIQNKSKVGLKQSEDIKG